MNAHQAGAAENEFLILYSSRFAEAQHLLLAEDAAAADLVNYVITLRHGRWVRAARVRWADEARELLDLARRKGNRALIARLKQLEKALP